MIARTWSGHATIDKAADYERHFTTQVAPALGRIAGHRGAFLLRRDSGTHVEFVAVTLWDSIETVKQFAGNDPDVAHIEPEGRAALAEFDEFARNYDVAWTSVRSDTAAP